MRYRLNKPTMVLAFRDNHQAAVTVQPDRTIEVLGPAEDDRFVVVEIENQQFLMFESDLIERGRPIGKRPRPEQPRCAKAPAGFGG
jgi:hypothetical protein